MPRRMREGTAGPGAVPGGPAGPRGAPDAAGLRALQRRWMDELAGRRPRRAAGGEFGGGAGQWVGREPGRQGTFRRPPWGAVEDRWEIYARGYVNRIAEALENDYPALRRILGAGPFLSLSARYVAAFPPRSFDIGRSGDRLAAFLATDPLTGDLPFLPDLARFEWSLAEAFVAPDAEPIAWSDLTRLSAEALADLPLRLLPGTALLRSRWPLHDLRACKDLPDGEIDLQVEGRPCALLVHRSGLEVVRRTVGDDEARFLEAARRAPSLALIQESLPGSGGPEDAARLIGLFRRFVDEGLFHNPEPPRDGAGPITEEDA